ncbi:hypothetical protein ABZ774_31385, partial [Streptomyces sp. NPDC047802]|uniref:hypothetical protein n=1 Tax=Streptomyces sp. NPDC047802 TaxID=3157204 RepID=UPI0033C53533
NAVDGTKQFVTALQLDTKLDGIPASVLAAALKSCRPEPLRPTASRPPGGVSKLSIRFGTTVEKNRTQHRVHTSSQTYATPTICTYAALRHPPQKSTVS